MSLFRPPQVNTEHYTVHSHYGAHRGQHRSEAESTTSSAKRQRQTPQITVGLNQTKTSPKTQSNLFQCKHVSVCRQKTNMLPVCLIFTFSDSWRHKQLQPSAFGSPSPPSTYHTVSLSRRHPEFSCGPDALSALMT